MSVLVWNPEWETGVARIDAQHRELFHRLDALVEAVPEPDFVDRAPVLLPHLLDYVETHFQDEEAAMEATDYTWIEAHRARHADLREKAGALAAQLAEDPAGLTEPMMSWFMEWLIHHIDGEDRRLARHLRKHGAGPVGAGA